MRASLPQKDVQSLIRERHAFRTRFFVLKIARRHHGRPRVGFAFSRGVGSAVLRNRFKRRLRAWVQSCADELCGCDVLVLSRAGLMRISDTAWGEERETLDAVAASVAKNLGDAV